MMPITGYPLGAGNLTAPSGTSFHWSSSRYRPQREATDGVRADRGLVRDLWSGDEPPLSY